MSRRSLPKPPSSPPAPPPSPRPWPARPPTPRPPPRPSQSCSVQVGARVGTAGPAFGPSARRSPLHVARYTSWPCRDHLSARRRSRRAPGRRGHVHRLDLAAHGRRQAPPALPPSAVDRAHRRRHRRRTTHPPDHPRQGTPAGAPPAPGLIVGRRSAAALMAGVLLPSGNDAAEALTGSHPRGRAAFVAAMNAKAAAPLRREARPGRGTLGLTAAGFALPPPTTCSCSCEPRGEPPSSNPSWRCPRSSFGRHRRPDAPGVHRTDFVNKMSGARGGSG